MKIHRSSHEQSRHSSKTFIIYFKGLGSKLSNMKENYKHHLQLQNTKNINILLTLDFSLNFNAVHVTKYVHLCFYTNQVCKKYAQK